MARTGQAWCAKPRSSTGHRRKRRDAHNRRSRRPDHTSAAGVSRATTTTSLSATGVRTSRCDAFSRRCVPSQVRWRLRERSSLSLTELLRELTRDVRPEGGRHSRGLRAARRQSPSLLFGCLVQSRPARSVQRDEGRCSASRVTSQASLGLNQPRQARAGWEVDGAALAFWVLVPNEPGR